MASSAGWQTSESGGGQEETTATWRPGHRSEALGGTPLQSSLDALLNEPMDQDTVQSLLRRLVYRVEETERRYGQALDELHARLDQLSLTTSAARTASTPENADTFDRLHAQVSSLAKRLEGEPKNHLDDFERLGQALSGGLHDDFGREPTGATQPEPAPSAFAQSIHATRRGGRLAPELAPPLDWDSKPAVPPVELDNRLTEMANRLEQSIGAAMPSSTIEALNARLEKVGNQIAQSLDATPNRAALQHLEQQIADMGQQLTRAEEQLGRLGGVEDRLLQLLGRLESQDTSPKSPEIDAAQLQEIAAKAAVEAARLVADDSQKTTDRLEAMQRELNAAGDTSRLADDRLNSTLQSVHESLNQLVQQVERPANRPPQTNPFIAKTDRKGPTSHGQPASASPTPAAVAPQPARAPQAEPEAERPRQPNPAAQAGRRSSTRASADQAERRVKETLRDRLENTTAKTKPRNLLSAFERARAPHVDAAAQDLGRNVGAEVDEPAAPGADEDMVAAARRAAQAATAQAAALAESREERPAARKPIGEVRATEQGGARRRPYLIISAAILLTISAFLLYGRLGSGTGDDMGVIPQNGAALPADGAAEPAASNQTVPAMPAPQTGQPGSYGSIPSPAITPLPDLPPVQDRMGDAGSAVTDIPKTQSPRMPESEITPAPQLASLTSDENSPLPSDVVFTVEEPASATEVAMAEKLTTTSARGPMPPEAIGSKPLREAASRGNPIAQYTVGIRYIDGRGVMADPKTGSAWLERAARSGLAPAQYRLGTMYERGLGVAPNIDTARSWYLAAAERGNVKAMHNLAVSVSGNGGAAPNYAIASKWYGQAALRGLADSQFNLGILAEHGLGQTKDLAEAYKWYILAAKQGDNEAQKRRDIVSAQLSPKTIVAIDGKLATWKPKTISPEANIVVEPLSWDNKTAANGGSNEARASTLVNRAQVLLNKLGYDVGVPDGLAGEKTRAGVKRFQERNGLDQTGEVTVPLLAQLEALAS